jgi:hypothetical protein
MSDNAIIYLLKAVPKRITETSDMLPRTLRQIIHVAREKKLFKNAKKNPSVLLSFMLLHARQYVGQAHCREKNSFQELLQTFQNLHSIFQNIAKRLI